MNVRSPRSFIPALALAGFILAAPAVVAGQDRDATKTRAQRALADIGPKIGVNFRVSQNNPYIFVGSLTQGLTNAESFEILVIITPKETMGVQVYPHVNGGYINVDKASDSEGLKSKLLNYNDSHFLYWGMDDEHDIFAMFNFTLESGFPLESFEIVLRSIENLDEYVGELKDLAGM